jgi:hypothetical protein
MPGIILSRSSLNLSHPSLWKWRKRVIWKRFPQRLDEIKPIGNRKFGSVGQQTLDIAHKIFPHRRSRTIHKSQADTNVRPSISGVNCRAAATSSFWIERSALWMGRLAALIDYTCGVADASAPASAPPAISPEEFPTMRCAVLLLALLCTCLPAGCLPAAAAADPLRVGMELAYPPFEMTDTSGKPSGVSVRLAEALGSHLGREVRIENIAFDGLIPALKTGKIDCIISSMTATPERATSIAFSAPYLKTGLALLVGTRSPVQRPISTRSAARSP